MFTRWMKIDHRKSVLIIGPRRSGKTTFLKAACPDYSYTTLDDLDLLDWAKRDPKGLVSRLGPRGIIDEIQRSPQLTVAVKYAIDNEGARILMTGSSSIGLLDAAADTMAGRVELYSMPTACWGEERGEPDHALFTDEPSPLNIKEAMRSLDDAMTFGGFPEVVAAGSAEEKETILRNYKNTYFVRDLMQMANLENVEGLQAILANIGRSIGSHLEISNFARESNLSVPTTRKYLNTLYRSELAFRLHGYQFGPAKRFVKAAKSYFVDNGIIAGLNLRLNEGQLLENFVIAELEKRRKLGFIKADQFFYYKSQAGREVDLVFETAGVRYAVEIKATRTPTLRDAANLRDFIAQSDGPTKGFLFHLGEEKKELDGVMFLPVATLYRGI